MTQRRPDGLPLAAAVDVVVPLWGAPEALARCLQSVLACTDLRTNRLILSVDGPQPAAVEDVLAPLATVAGVVIDRSARRSGYPATVNRALAGSRADAVLLNSDTVVTPGWLSRTAVEGPTSGFGKYVTPPERKDS